VPWFRTDRNRVADELEKLYGEYLRLCAQLEAQAEIVPYAHVGERLAEIRANEEKNAGQLARRLTELGRQPSPNGSRTLRGGRNSWERLVATLEDYRALLRQLGQLGTRWDDESPDDAALVGRLRDNALQHREILVDLVARSDPHALD
jgi:hypothetical protein